MSCNHNSWIPTHLSVGNSKSCNPHVFRECPILGKADLWFLVQNVISHKCGIWHEIKYLLYNHIDLPRTINIYLKNAIAMMALGRRGVAKESSGSSLMKSWVCKSIHKTKRMKSTPWAKGFRKKLWILAAFLQLNGLWAECSSSDVRKFWELKSPYLRLPEVKLHKASQWVTLSTIII